MTNLPSGHSFCFPSQSRPGIFIPPKTREIITFMSVRTFQVGDRSIPPIRLSVGCPVSAPKESCSLTCTRRHACAQFSPPLFTFIKPTTHRKSSIFPSHYPPSLPLPPPFPKLEIFRASCRFQYSHAKPSDKYDHPALFGQDD